MPRNFKPGDLVKFRRLTGNIVYRQVWELAMVIDSVQGAWNGAKKSAKEYYILHEGEPKRVWSAYLNLVQNTKPRRTK
jgi:hypothetical protein